MGQLMFLNNVLPKTIHTNNTTFSLQNNNNNNTTLYISHTYMREINKREAGRGIS